MSEHKVKTYVYKGKEYTYKKKRELLKAILIDYNLEEQALYQNFSVWAHKLSNEHTFEEKLNVYITYLILMDQIKNMRK